MGVLHTVRNAVRRLGIDITRYPAGWSGPQLIQLMSEHKTDVVLDVGANVGEYGELLRKCGYGGRLVSFEPLSAPCRELRRRAALDDTWTVKQVALSDRSGSAEINVSGNRGASSSLLPMSSLHVEAAPYARYVASELVSLQRLDELWPEVVAPQEGVFLKLDVQGYEAHVLRGSGDYLAECVGMQIETSFVPLYEGGLEFTAVTTLVDELGFTVMGIIPGFTDPRTGQMLQCDIVMFRNGDAGTT